MHRFILGYVHAYIGFSKKKVVHMNTNVRKARNQIDAKGGKLAMNFMGPPNLRTITCSLMRAQTPEGDNCIFIFIYFECMDMVMCDGYAGCSTNSKIR